jgi:hypothetical protein
MPFTAGMISLLNTKSDANHTDDRERVAVERERAPDDRRIGAESTFPETVAQDHDGRLSRLVLVSREDAAAAAFAPKSVKSDDDTRAPSTRSGSPRPVRVEARANRGGDVAEDLVVGSDVEILAGREPVLRDVRARAIAARESRSGPRPRTAADGAAARSSTLKIAVLAPIPKRERRHGDRGESRLTREDAKSVTKVLPPRFHSALAYRGFSHWLQRRMHPRALVSPFRFGPPAPDGWPHPACPAMLRTGAH